MRAGLIKLVPLAEVEDHFFRICQRVLEVNEVEHEVADRVEYDVLREDLWYAHCLSLASETTASLVFLATVAFLSAALLAAPDALERLTKLVDVAHKTGGGADQFLLVLVHSILFLSATTVPPLLIFLYRFLELLIQNFLQHTLPNVLLLPDSMIVHILSQVIFLAVLARGSDPQPPLRERQWLRIRLGLALSVTCILLPLRYTRWRLLYTLII